MAQALPKPPSPEAARWLTVDEGFIQAVQRATSWRNLIGTILYARVDIYRLHHGLVSADARWHTFGFERVMLPLLALSYRAAAAGSRPIWPDGEGHYNYALLCEVAGKIPGIRPEPFIDTACAMHPSCTQDDTNVYTLFPARYGSTHMPPAQFVHDCRFAFNYMIWLLGAVQQLAVAERDDLIAIDPLLAHAI